MFDNNSPAPEHPAVDDIFAETDKAPAGGPSAIGAEVDARRVGLTAEEDASEPETKKKPNGGWFRIAIISLVVVIVALIGYLVYSRFLANKSQAPATAVTPIVNSPATQSTVVLNTVSTSSVTTSGSSLDNLNAATTASSTGLGTSSEIATGTEVIATTTASSTLDSDSDGLTDQEEASLGTNPLKADTDSDGLTDYEEVKIYHTNPLISDTDGDGYSDGQEVKSGYNPNGPGKLPGLAPVK